MTIETIGQIVYVAGAVGMLAVLARLLKAKTGSEHELYLYASQAHKNAAPFDRRGGSRVGWQSLQQFNYRF
jgi:hypothetical protein